MIKQDSGNVNLRFPIGNQILRYIRDNSDMPHMVPYDYQFVWPSAMDFPFVKVFIQREFDEPWERFDVPITIGEGK